jgi:acyl-CoA thioesterase-1
MISAIRALALGTALALATAASPFPANADNVAGSPSCGAPVTVVAIGSSSTFGAGASTPEKSYPSRLAVELKALFPSIAFRVVNRGVNGEVAREMLARFNRDVFSENPDLVLWQVGSNSVLNNLPITQTSTPLHQGLERLRRADADVVLINPQYAPKVIAKPDAERMVQLIDATTKETNVDLFPRFSLMRYWRLVKGLPFSAFVSPDELHMNDWGYGCVAQLLAGAIKDAATRATVTAVVPGSRP